MPEVEVLGKIQEVLLFQGIHENTRVLYAGKEEEQLENA